MFNDNAQLLRPCGRTMATQKSCNLIEAALLAAAEQVAYVHNTRPSLVKGLACQTTTVESAILRPSTVHRVVHAH